jgi:uncharacterized membrane protein
MKKPKIKVKKDLFDIIIDVITITGLIILIVYPFLFYNTLPEKIPTHFDINGYADAFGNKNSIFTLPVIGVIIFLLLYVLSKFPHILNYPVEVTDNNAENLYRYAIKMLKIINLTTVWLFAYINYQNILIAQIKIDKINEYVILIFVFVFSLIPLYYIVKMSRIND